MATATFHSLTSKEQLLVAETDKDRLRSLDEDALIELHGRIRRARDKAVTQHRKEFAAHLGSAKARGKVIDAPRRSASKAEVFEAALARVSTSLAAAARASAKELRDERLTAARSASGGGTTKKKSTTTTKKKKAATRTASTPTAAAARSTKKTPIQKKAAASARATGARRQAAADSR